MTLAEMCAGQMCLPSPELLKPPRCESTWFALSG
jgi:hypothetical protein